MKIVQTVSDKTLTCSYSWARSCQSKPSLMTLMQSHLIPTLCHISWTSHITHIIMNCANTQKRQTSVISSVICWPTKKLAADVSVGIEMLIFADFVGQLFLYRPTCH